MKVLKGNNNKIAKIWVDDLAKVESQTLDQIKIMLEFPALFKHIAVMPDTHLGYGAVVGGVVATSKAIVPNIVGVDIGCGMSAFKTNVKLDKETMGKEFWRTWKSQVDRNIPTGFNKHGEKQKAPKELSDSLLLAISLHEIAEGSLDYQLGTLGGGNHFLEAQVDEEDYIWFMVHSGSRHIGLRIAAYYNKQAQMLNERYHSKCPKDLWFLPLDDDSGQAYLHDMKWATDFALENRWRMLERMVGSFVGLVPNKFPDKILKVREEGINIHHNFASIENHFGGNVIVHRKGATQAKKEQIGIIPGSMGSNSYIVKGRGNPDSYTSCSHGAGRRMSRSQAKNTFKSSDMQKALIDTFTKPTTAWMDEIPMAYKDIDEVIANQLDLVEVLHTLKPIITIKGEGK